MWSDHQSWPMVESTVEYGAPAVVRARELHRESHRAEKMSKSFDRRDETEKGNFASSKATCQEMTMLLVVRSRYR
jgi:hypothetical protein